MHTQNKEFKHYTEHSHQITKEEEAKRTTKTTEDNEQNVGMYLPISNYFKC